ncbi:MAG: SDR family oxidoreductase [Anaerolineae bacterium]|nr:SDR family oxidoreductase [Anaerolineae bacterium]
MSAAYLEHLFGIAGRVAVITGGGGVLCGEIGRALGRLGVKVVVMSRSLQSTQKVADEIVAAGGVALALPCDVRDRAALEVACETVLAQFGRVDILINGAGGNRPQATTMPDLSFFNLPADALREVFDLNLMGTMLACQVFGRPMAAQGEGCIINISSMSASRPLTRIPAYSAAKAAVDNFTRWLAVHMAQEYSPHIRVNAIAPGFFLTEQNRYLLTERETGALTPRGHAIIAHTPMGRFGEPADLIGAVVWLVSPAAAFVTGAVIPIDGGFSAFSGV